MRRPIWLFLPAFVGAAPAFAAAPVTYSKDVAPILRDKCVSCHSTGLVSAAV